MHRSMVLRVCAQSFLFLMKVMHRNVKKFEIS